MKKEYETPNHTWSYELTRIHNRSFPPPNKFWLVVKIIERTKEGKRSYTKSYPVLFNTPEDRVTEMADGMYKALVKQFSLV